MVNRWGNSDRLFSWAPVSQHMVTAAMKWKDVCSWKKSYDKPKQCIKKQRHCFADKGPCNQSYGFSSSHVQTWELEHTEGWAPKNWCFQTVVLEKTLENPVDCKEIQPVNPKGNQPSLEGPMLMQKLQYFGHLIWRADSLEKTLMLERLRAGGEGEDRRWDGWMESLTIDESEQTPQNSEGRGNLVCCSPWGRKE